MDTKSDIKPTTCTIVFKNNEKTKLPKSMIDRFGLLSAQEVKNNTYNLHTMDIEDFILLLENIYTPNPKLWFELSPHLLKTYDYLNTDPTAIRSKPQFVKALFDKVFGHLSIISADEKYEDILDYTYENGCEFEVEGATSIYIRKHKDKYHIDASYTFNQLNIQKIIIDLHRIQGSQLIDKPIIYNKYSIISLRLYGNEEADGLEHDSYKVHIRLNRL
jgi:hypothetical protein